MLLAKQFSEKLKLDVDDKILIRVKDTPTQTNLTKQQRENNMKNAFKVVNKVKILNKTILLIDDVYTTGSTLNECAKTLLKSGAKAVYCLTVAHTKMENAL
jgi:ComF family protein